MGIEAQYKLIMNKTVTFLNINIIGEISANPEVSSCHCDQTKSRHSNFEILVQELDPGHIVGPGLSPRVSARVQEEGGNSLFVSDGVANKSDTVLTTSWPGQ